MVNYLNGFAGVPNGTASMIRAFYRERNETAFRLFYDNNLFTPDEVDYCIRQVEESTNDLMERVSRLAREISTKFSNLTKVMTNYIDNCEIDSNFVM